MSIDYYKGFNNSIGTFGGVLQYINGRRCTNLKKNILLTLAKILQAELFK